MKKHVFVPAAGRFACAWFILLCISLFSFTVKAQNLVFAKGFSNPAPEGGSIYNYDIAMDGAGNSYVTGYFYNIADFDPGPGTQNLNAGQGFDIFLAKYDASGNYVWAKRLGSTGSDRGYSVAVDASGNSYLTGHFYQTVDFDPGAGTANLTATGQLTDIFLAKYDASGNYVWAKNIAGSGSDRGSSIMIDASGNSYITGQFTGTADFDPGAGTQMLTATGTAEDIFLAKYDASGNYVWANRIGDVNADIGYAVAVDASGNSYITGEFSGTVDFDPGAGTNSLTSGGLDIFLAKYDASGNYVWAKRMGGGGNDAGYGVAVDASGNSYITGRFLITADFDPGPGTQNLTSAGAGETFLAKYDASGNYVWARRMGGAGHEYANAVAVDATGNSYITGVFTGTSDFDPGAGAQNLSSSGDDIFVAKYDASGNYLWAKSMGGTTPDLGQDRGNAVAVDALGNSYWAGSFTGTADFDPGAGTAALTSGADLVDAYVLQLNNAGNYVWAKSLGGYRSATAFDQGKSIKVDAAGNSYVTGYFTGTVDFDAGPGTQNLTAVNGSNIFLAKYDASGNYVWAKQIGGAGVGIGNGNGNALDLDASGNIIITGEFTGTFDFDPGAGTHNLTASYYDIFLAKYDASGNYIWAKQLGSTSSDIGYSVAVDASGNCYVTGLFSLTVDFDPGTGTANLTAPGGQLTDIFLAKYDAAGNYVWAKNMGGPGSDRGSSVKIDASGNSYLTGQFTGTADFDPGAGTQMLTATGDDIFLAKYDASGNYVWAKGMGGTGNDAGYALAVDASGNSYITGSYSNTVDFDPGAGTQALIAAGGTDIFLAKYDASGNYVWAGSMGGGSTDVGYSLAIDASGNSYITGYLYGTADFDPGPGRRYLIAAGGADIFLAKYDASGNYVSARSMGGLSADISYALAIDNLGDMYLTGQFSRTVDFDPGAGTQTYTSINAIDFFIAKYTPGNTLPVRLESFRGEFIKDRTAVLLEWTTADQENHAYFEVERSNGGGNFTAIGRVNGCGTCDLRQQYSFKDLQPLTGTTYYRLRMVDKDGNGELSKWISIDKKESGGALVLYPAVTTGKVEAYYNNAGGTARIIRITIFDGVGKPVQQRKQALADGNNLLRFDLFSQARGVYYVQMAEENGKVLATGSVIRN